MKKLRELSGEIVDVTPTGIRRGGSSAVLFECPCGGGHKLCIPFSPTIGGAPPSPGPQWTRVSGETVDDLTLSPSLAISSGPSGQECWHGWMRGGSLTP